MDRRHDTAAVILVKGRLGREEALREDLQAIRTAGCKKCRVRPDRRICKEIDFLLLGSAAGRFDFALVATASNSRGVHDLVLKCIRTNLQRKVVDTETTFMFEIDHVKVESEGK